MTGLAKLLAIVVAATFIGVALVLPTLNSYVDTKRGAAAAGSRATDQPEAEPPPTENPSDEPRLSRGALLRTLPALCLRAPEEPERLGNFAAWDGNRVRIVSPNGRSRGAVGGGWPAGWSTSGRFLATDDGRLWSSRGAKLGRLLPGDGGAWAWSTAGQCAVRVARDGRALVLGVPGHPPRELLDAAALGGAHRLGSFAFSPEGDTLALVTVLPGPRPRARSLLVVDLRTGHSRVAVEPSSRVVRIRLAGWSPDGAHVFYWTSEGGRIPDVAQLRSVSAASPSDPSGYGKGAGPRVPTQKHSFTSCGGRVIAVVQRGRDHRLAELERGSAASLLSPVGRDFASPSCSPRGRFIVAERKPTSAGMAANRVVLLKGDGTFIRELHGGMDAEHAPRWGPRSSVSFVHHVHERHMQAWMGEIWFIDEVGIARPTGLIVQRVRGTWAYDWSADNAP